MSSTSASPWPFLSSQGADGERLIARLFNAELCNRLYAALDSQSNRHLLLHLLESEEGLDDKQSRGLTAVTEELHVAGAEGSRYLRISCSDPAGYPALDLIAHELASRLQGGVEKPAECVERILSKWRRFWGQAVRPLLSKHEQFGLFAEVTFLHKWLAPAIGFSQSLERWRGPFGARHDFEWHGRSVEVKATSNVHKALHVVHGLEQLAPPETGDLLFFSVRIREEAGGTSSLGSAIQECRADIGEDAGALTTFEAALTESGYSPVYEREYDKLRFRVVEGNLYRVVEDFPRITSAHLIKGIPAGVEEVSYEINLSGFKRLIIATTNDASVIASLA